MQRIDGRLVLSPTDLTKHLACPHVTTLDLAAIDDSARGGPAHGGAKAADDALNLVFSKGTDHERAYLQRLRQAGPVVIEIPTRYDLAGRIVAEQQTLAAMRAGVDVIYCRALTSRATSRATSRKLTSATRGFSATPARWQRALARRR